MTFPDPMFSTLPDGTTVSSVYKPMSHTVVVHWNRGSTEIVEEYPSVDTKDPEYALAYMHRRAVLTTLDTTGQRRLP